MQHALIVDDSKTASYALRQMLQRLHFQVDTTDSAEAALDYLKECKPQLIFMDHMMPGMDGFDAVKVIKADPVTAEIPIVMYTAKEGEVYVGQARALGAADILTKPASDDQLQQVLQRLKQQQQSRAFIASPSLQRVAADSADDVINNVMPYARSETDNPAPRSSAVQTIPTRTSRDESHAWFLSLITIVALISALALLVLYIQERQAAQAQRSKFAETLVWSFSQAGAYAWNEIPFNDRRLSQLQSLVDQLRELQFRGTLIVESRVGDFCLSRQSRSDGRSVRQLPPGDMPLTACVELGQDEYRALELAGQQSPAFRAYLSKMKNDPQIAIQLVPLGSARPLRAYPQAADAAAAEWNAAAASNQIVTYRLSAAP